MSVMDKIRNLVGKNSDKTKAGLDKATSFIDEKTGGRHSDKIGRARDRAQEFVDDSAGESGRTSEPNSRTNEPRNTDSEKP